MVAWRRCGGGLQAAAGAARHGNQDRLTKWPACLRLMRNSGERGTSPDRLTELRAALSETVECKGVHCLSKCKERKSSQPALACKMLEKAAEFASIRVVGFAATKKRERGKEGFEEFPGRLKGKWSGVARQAKDASGRGTPRGELGREAAAANPIDTSQKG